MLYPGVFLSRKRGRLSEIDQMFDFPDGKILLGQGSRPVFADLAEKLEELMPGAINLQRYYLLIGNSQNKAEATLKIDFRNLPPLQAETILTGDIYRGTPGGEIEASSALTIAEADIVAINARFAAANFIMGSGNFALKNLMLGSQFLDTLNPGLLKQNAGTISIAQANVDYLASVTYKNVVIGNINDKGESAERILFQNLPEGKQNNLITFNALSQPVLTERLIFDQFPDFATDYFLMGDANNRPVLVNEFKLTHFPDVQYRNILVGSNANRLIESDVLKAKVVVMEAHNDLPNGVSLYLLKDNLLKKDNDTIVNATLNQNLIFIGTNLNEVGTSDVLSSKIVTFSAHANLPNAEDISDIDDGLIMKQGLELHSASLTYNKIWMGDIKANVQEVDPPFAPIDATFILQKSHNDLKSAQALADLNEAGILKTSIVGAISIAKAGGDVATDDYVDPATLQTEVEGIQTNITEVQESLETQIVEVQTNLEAQIVTLTGFTTLGLLTDFLVSIGFTAGYGEYLWRKYNPLRDYQNYTDTDNRDKEDEGASLIWFDSDGFDPEGHHHEPGLRIVGWDSSSFFESPLAPISIGLFGYRNDLGEYPIMDGYCFRSEFFNDDSNNRRYPKNFGLYEAAGNRGFAGFDRHKTLLFLYDRSSASFTYYKNVILDNSNITSPAPTEGGHLANKSYVDSKAQEEAAAVALTGTQDQIVVANGAIALADQTRLKGKWFRVPTSSGPFSSSATITQNEIYLRWNPTL